MIFRFQQEYLEKRALRLFHKWFYQELIGMCGKKIAQGCPNSQEFERFVCRKILKVKSLWFHVISV